MNKRFIVLIDFSEYSSNLIKYACDWSQEVSAKILLHHQTHPFLPVFADNLKTAKVMMKLAPESLAMERIGIADLPMFNEDLEEKPPKEWVRFKEQISEADGILFFTPEYNRSVPAVLKNALDVASRPYGKNSWDAKPAAIVSVSIGAISGWGQSSFAPVNGFCKCIYHGTT